MRSACARELQICPRAAHAEGFAFAKHFAVHQSERGIGIAAQRLIARGAMLCHCGGIVRLRYGGLWSGRRAGHAGQYDCTE